GVGPNVACAAHRLTHEFNRRGHDDSNLVRVFAVSLTGCSPSRVSAIPAPAMAVDERAKRAPCKTARSFCAPFWTKLEACRQCQHKTTCSPVRSFAVSLMGCIPCSVAPAEGLTKDRGGGQAF